MARALSASDLSDHRDAQPGEWQALRGELVALLDQVETQYARVRTPEPGYDALAERVRDLRYQVGEGGGSRHREALRSVQRAVDRFSSERDGDGFEGRETRQNPQHVLQSAINEIRVRQGAPIAAPRGAGEIEALAHSVTGLSGRLERLEGELRTQRSSNGSVKEIGEQVAQLTHVVELLAGAVGETGQVKRLEAQIADLAQTMAQPQAPDLSAMTKRIDDLAKTVERLADIQIQHFGHEAKDGTARAAAVQNGMTAIEESVRSVYDRIDAIEKTLAMPSAEFERLTEEMASFTEALRGNGSGPDAMVPIIEAINDRIAGLEGKDGVIGGLKADIGALRNKVMEAMEPRFAAIEMQIEALSGRLGEGKSEAGIGHIEAQIRQLVARMDQTSEQLSHLAKLYAQQEDRAEPDFEALAGMVARKTAEAVSGGNAGLDADGLDEIERRVSRLFASAPASEELSGMHDSIRRVDERLDRLEAMLSNRDKPEAPAKPEPKAAIAPAAPAALASLDSDLVVPAMARKPTVRIPGPPERDDMPNNPSEDRPLTDPGFGDDNAVRAALEEKRSPSDAILNRLGAGKPRMDAPGFIDPDSIVRPPKPASSLDNVRESFVEETAAPMPVEAAAAPEPEPMAEPVVSSSRSTFIEAARRAQRQNAAKIEAESNSVIARALARFQGGNAVAGESISLEPEVPAEDAKPSKAELRKAAKAEKAAAKKARKAEADADHMPGLEALQPRQSFLSRNRRPLLLGALLVAVSVLALNLVAQRISAPAQSDQPASASTTPEAQPETPAPQTTGEASPLVLPEANATPTALATLPDNPDIVPTLDATTVSSINPQAAMNFTSPTQVAAIPAALKATTLTEDELAPEPLASPVKVELPPEAIGPIELRQAAADGDARAQFEVAAILTEGRAVPQDLSAAAVWYERAAAQGFVPAEYRLGSLYEAGKGVAKDLEQARLWYQRAAEAGNRMSMHNLAALYAGGQLGKQDFAAASEWFEQAAMRGLTDSQFNLGMLYARGLGVPQNLETSYKWFSLAAASGDADAGKARDDIAKSLDAPTVTRLTGEVHSWKPQAIDLAANFAPIGTWSDKFDAGQAINDQKVVMKVQAVLAKLGYDVGTPDGKAGPKTADAIKAFETATGMSETGTVNPRLLAVLGSQPV
ncbi:hypothetical protein GCM10011321_25910 [Youhaiella tibetensis]|uniref:Uncharacterized protein n=1 Tax=Paradevosia tibetensis TaxID=1447062 RepID=A0A5B9DK22_9HYPH|nr:peptidoglycan-binding protein [Youhaiella tibetensis]QEE19396.1 hypothetical protein FNA67_04055 [Youhaiella tibetensis]GGF33532.1 hypothetical protein GCM10011321_25910 [Youhaiella tibetensis]